MLGFSQNEKELLRLEAIVEESYDAIIGKTLDGIITRWNGGATRMFGYTREEMIGKSIADLFAPGNRDELPGLLERIKKGETIADYDSIWIKKNGTNANVQFSISPIHSEGGLIVGSSLVGRDISELKKKITIIENSEKYLGGILNAVADPVFVKDKEYKFVFANDALCRMLGIPRENIIGKTLGESLPKEQMDVFLKNDKMVFETGEENISDELLAGGDGRNLNIVTKKTRYIDSAGNKYLVGVIRDITEIKRSENELKEEKDKYQLLINNIPDVIWASDSNGSTSYISSNVEKEIGFTSEEFIKNSEEIWIRRIHPEDAEGMLAAYRALFVENKKYDIEYRYQKKNGEWMWVRDRAIGINFKDGIACAIGMFTDITESKKAKEMIEDSNNKILELHRTKNEFISLTAHQLRSPITALMGYVSLFKESFEKENFTEEQKEIILIVEKSAKNMQELVSFLLKITQAESGKIRLALAPIDLKEITEMVIEVLGNELNHKNQTVEIIQDPIPFPFVFLDKEMIKQIIMNLLSNANRYSPNNSVIKVSMVMKGPHIEFSVNDSGMGIPKEEQGKVFERFFRASNAVAQVSEGTGLGLSLVKSLIEVWGGKIWFESEENKGTTFYFTMPIVGKIEGN